MVSTRQSRGKLGEEIAQEYLVRCGYEILFRNWRSGRFEIDIVARDADEYVVVEVRTRRGTNFGSPEESITPEKQERIRNAGFMFLQENDLEFSAWRIDVIIIELDTNEKLSRMEHYINAVEDGS